MDDEQLLTGLLGVVAKGDDADDEPGFAGDRVSDVTDDMGDVPCDDIDGLTDVVICLFIDMLGLEGDPPAASVTLAAACCCSLWEIVLIHLGLASDFFTG